MSEQAAQKPHEQVWSRRRLFLPSVRARLAVWYALMLTAMLILLALGVHQILRKSLRDEIQKEFARSLRALEGVVAESSAMLPFFEAHSTVDYFVVRQLPAATAVHGDSPEPSAGAPALETTSSLPTAPPATALPSPESLAPAAPVVYESSRWRDESLDPAGVPLRHLAQWPWSTPVSRSFRFDTRKVTTPTGSYELIVAQDAAPYERSLSRLTVYLFLVSPLALLVVGAGGYFLAGRALSPVASMASMAARIHADHLSERLPVDNPHDEFGRLASAFNETLARLEESFERLRRFTADASHELRTPLTVIRTVGEVGLSEPYNAEASQEAIASMLEEADRLTRLVDGLLLLTRGDSTASGSQLPEMKPFRVFDLTANAAELLQVLAEEKSQRLVVEGNRTLDAHGDWGTLRQALLNLIDNAIRYTPAGGRITIRTCRSPAGFPAIEVRDEGPGIALEHRERIFDRFYRVDGIGTPHPSDATRAAGCGLGLAIAKWAAEANHGWIEFETELGRGSIFRLVMAANF